MPANLEVFKFGGMQAALMNIRAAYDQTVYLFFPISMMYYYGNPEWYFKHVLPFREKFYPSVENTTKALPQDHSSLRQELDRIKAEKFARRMERERLQVWMQIILLRYLMQRTTVSKRSPIMTARLAFPCIIALNHPLSNLNTALH
ncbi:hypothetical protein SISNIDRAFT_488743 [Sistotremastrum niveocremeum HHB9708]|uniref:Uncharacterized protein n=1 Tax=Sistotremastrum niveocremeum HHB9708 TaxID=1314777 RepID=A0A164QQH2_9AGAM|nr:hypothetical protein SISNIDRAFT_488743 [Sistotremastrum niveocremeum HHB9708]